ncbi:MAG: M3 family oligoendopeptidase [Armatimonadetes bacterium]|nr:M3 family oligoendopeptidase [Armatimonadota bacterium]
MSQAVQAPVWDLTPFFPSIESSEFETAVANLKNLVAKAESMVADFAMEDVSSQATPDQLADAISLSNEIGTDSRIIFGYVSLKIAADASDSVAQAKMSELKPLQTRISKFSTAVTAWIGQSDVEAAISSNPVCGDHAFPLRKTKTKATHLMSGAEEKLAADLSESGDSAWSKLYFDFSSNIEVTVGEETVPMSAARAMAFHADAETRRSAYHAELDAWKANELPIAACLNSIKGANNLLAEKRGWGEQLDITLFNCNMDRESLEAMLDAARDSFPAFRKYLQAKGKALGHTNGLPFYDIFAPMGADRDWSWDQAADFVEDGFRSYSDKLGDFARRSFNENWHDVPPRKGKRDGAFCSGIRNDESRMLHNYKESFKSVSTLAHELGHAYHNVCLKDRTPMQKSTPMTLAETASIFCETIIKRRALKETSGDERLAILEASIQGECQVVVDITSRYLFESNGIAKRKERELSAAEMCEIMAQAQRDTYGDGLDQDLLHPYMWAVKPHYYGYMAFYNFPYMFGLLFALGLYRIYEAEPNGFHARYDDLLSSTGMHMAADLTDRFGINIRDKAFWAGSLAVVEEDINQFLQAVK